MMSDRAFAALAEALDAPAQAVPAMRELFAPRRCAASQFAVAGPASAGRGLNGFDCGDAELAGWLVDHALASPKADLARTCLASAMPGSRVRQPDHRSIRPEAAPRRYARGMPRHPIPTILIARLAVDRRYQRQRLGSRLLAEALRRAVLASDTAAARLVVVDAIDDDAAAFYRRWGFIAVPENPRRLFRKISDIRKTLEQP